MTEEETRKSIVNMLHRIAYRIEQDDQFKDKSNKQGRIFAYRHAATLVENSNDSFWRDLNEI